MKLPSFRACASWMICRASSKRCKPEQAVNKVSVGAAIIWGEAEALAIRIPCLFKLPRFAIHVA